ncbi:MFS transporter [Piscinibacter sakaiensis]|uniref:MFS transporter n=1 Tax=Piscinibacter sakaiensis TaxID=1547922 RepID=UPI003AB049C0
MRNALFPLGTLTLVQTLISLAVGTVPLYAVVAAPDMGIDLGMLGFFTAITYLTSTVASPYGGGVAERIGGVRGSQLCLFLTGAGIAMTASAWPPLFVLAAIFLGAGLGQATPTSSQILVRKTPPHLLPLVFSIRMTGVPGGNLLAGLSVPGLVILLGWRSTAIVVGALCLGLMALIHPLKANFDSESVSDSSGRKIDPPSFWGPINMVLKSAPLRILSLVSFLYCGAQLVLTTYIAIYFVKVGQMSLVDAGLAVSVAYGFGVGVRIFVTAVVVRWIRPDIIFGLLGCGIAVCCAVLSQMNEHWPYGFTLIFSGFMGAFAMSWNGLFLAEVARHAPNGKEAVATGAALSFAYFGAMVMPVLFGLNLSAGGSYQSGFLAMAMLTLVGGIIVLGFGAGKKSASQCT